MDLCVGEVGNVDEPFVRNGFAELVTRVSVDGDVLATRRWT